MVQIHPGGPHKIKGEGIIHAGNRGAPIPLAASNRSSPAILRNGITSEHSYILKNAESALKVGDISFEGDTRSHSEHGSQASNR